MKMKIESMLYRVRSCVDLLILLVTDIHMCMQETQLSIRTWGSTQKITRNCQQPGTLEPKHLQNWHASIRDLVDPLDVI